MVHKYKSFPVGKSGQRSLKKQFANQDNGGSQKSNSNPKPVANADVGAKAVHMKFLSMLGNNAHAQIALKGGRKTRIDPLSLKKIADSLLREVESQDLADSNEELSSDDEDSDSSDANSYQT